MNVRTILLAIALIALSLPLVTRADQPVLPNHALTPGATLPVGLDQICKPGYRLDTQINVPRNATQEQKYEAMRAAQDAHHQLIANVYARYGVRPNSREIVIDPLVPIGLGGAFTLQNLWPQPKAHSISDTDSYKNIVKDQLEVRMHELACTRTVPLAQLQHEIATNWITAYHKYLSTKPISNDKVDPHIPGLDGL